MMKSTLVLPAYFSLLIGCLSQVHAQDPPPPIVVDRVIQQQVNSGYRIVGSVVPLRKSMIGAAVGGRVEKLLVEVGDRLSANEPVAQLAIGTLLIEKSAAESELELYEQEHAELVNGSLPEEIAEAEAIAEGAKVAMDNAITHLNRLVMLQERGASTQADLDNASERANAARSRFAAASAALRRIRNGPRPERIAQAYARVQLQQERIRLIDDRISKHTIRTPFDGFVADEFTEMGSWITSGDPVVQVIQLDTVEVQAPVTAEYAVRLNLGETIRVEFPELPDRLLTGQVDRIVPQADPRARTFPVFIRVENDLSGEIPLLMAGMLARVDLPTGDERLLPLVPKDALVLNEDERYVFVIDPEPGNKTGTARKVPVKLGVAWEERIQVTGALREGELVAVVGNERLNEGMRVTIRFNGNETPEG